MPTIKPCFAFQELWGLTSGHWPAHRSDSHQYLEVLPSLQRCRHHQQAWRWLLPGTCYIPATASIPLERYIVSGLAWPPPSLSFRYSPVQVSPRSRVVMRLSQSNTIYDGVQPPIPSSIKPMSYTPSRRCFDGCDSGIGS